MSAVNPHVSVPRDERVELAADEQHDADIPSNIGAVSLDKSKDIAIDSRPHSASDSDVEKEAAVVSSDGATAASEDPNIVFWDGPNDPQNPLNWPAATKWGSIAVVSAVTLLSPLGSSMVAPGVPGIMNTFDNHSELLSGFVVSVYVLGFAVGPLSEFATCESHALEVLSC